MELLINTVCKAHIQVIFVFVRISGYRFQPVDVETFHVFFLDRMDSLRPSNHRWFFARCENG